MIFVDPDASLRSCLARPERRNVITSQQVAQLIAESFEAGDDCRSKLAALWKSIDNTRAMVEAFNKAMADRGGKSDD